MASQNKIITNKAGYKYFYDHNGNKVLVHRRVMEKELKRPIREGYEVHHINQNTKDNRIINLIK